MEQLYLNNKSTQKGQLLIEILLVIAITAIILPALLSGLYTTQNGSTQQTQRIQAVSLMKEGEEIIRNIKQYDWNAIATNGVFHPVKAGSAWALDPGDEQINNHTRTITIEPVYRDASGTIVTSGGTLDPSTKRVIVTVSWGSPISSNVTSTTYVTRYASNAAIPQTTIDEFEIGTTSGTTVTDTSGGEVTLGAGGGGGDWCQPSLALATQDLPKSGVANAISAIEGKIVAGTGENASGISFASIGVDTSHPPTPDLEETFDGYKTNDVFVEPGFAYLATDANTKEVVIINLNVYSDPPTNSKYYEEGYFDAPGNGDGNTVHVNNNYGYMTSGNKFYIFDLSSKSGSRNRVNIATDLNLSGTGVDIVVRGNYAFVVTAATSNQLQIIDISNPATPSITGQITVSNQAGRGLTVNDTGTRAYVVTAASSTQREFFIVNTQNKNAPSQVSGGSYDTNGMNPTGTTVVTGNKAIVVGTGGTTQYQVINISNESSPTSCAGLSIPTGINGITSVLQENGYAYSYIITGDASSELKIILGGAGDSFAFEGIFTSSPIDASAPASFNYFTPTYTLPPGTSLQFRVAVANITSGTCNNADYTFVGPDGSENTYFTGPGAIPLMTNGFYQNPGQCMKYRAYFSTNDTASSPILEEVIVNYSP